MKPKIPAGILPNDESIEFVGDRTHQRVYWFRNGAIHYFNDLPDYVLDALRQKYHSDNAAMRILSAITGNEMRQLELYTYYMYGDLDSTPDFANGKLAESENFLTGADCISINFDTKRVDIDGNVLNRKEIKILHFILQEMKDTTIADMLHITVSTFNYHKKRLFEKAGVYTKSGLIAKAVSQGILSM